MPIQSKFLLRLPADLRIELERVTVLEHRRSLANTIVFALSEWLQGRGYRANRE